MDGSCVEAVVGWLVGEFPLLPPRLIYGADADFQACPWYERSARQKATPIEFTTAYAHSRFEPKRRFRRYTQNARPQTIRAVPRVAMDVKFVAPEDRGGVSFRRFASHASVKKTIRRLGCVGKPIRGWIGLLFNPAAL